MKINLAKMRLTLNQTKNRVILQTSCCAFAIIPNLIMLVIQA